MKPVLTIGPVYCDLLLEGFSDIPNMGEELFLDSYVLSAGGNAIVASAISQLGVPSAILSTIGSDLMGEQLRSLLQEKQVGIDYLLSVPSQKTNLSLILHGAEDRSFLTWVQDFSTYAIQLERQLDMMDPSSFSHVHVCFEYLEKPCIQHFLGRAAEHAISISTGLGFQDSLDWNAQSESYLSYVDWCFMNLSEAKRITRKEDLYEIMAALQRHIAIPVITLGAEGACALSREGDLLHYPAEDVHVVNTTGSGDSFAAGFIYGLTQGYSLSKCLQFGNRLGSLTASSKDSVSPCIGRNVLEEYYG